MTPNAPWIRQCHSESTEQKEFVTDSSASQSSCMESVCSAVSHTIGQEHPPLCVRPAAMAPPRISRQTDTECRLLFQSGMLCECDVCSCSLNGGLSDGSLGGLGVVRRSDSGAVSGGANVLPPNT